MSKPHQTIRELYQAGSPTEWQDWLHEIQTQLISKNYLEGMANDGVKDFALRFRVLYEFFTSIDQQKHS